MKSLVFTIVMLFSISTMSFANKPESYLTGKLVKDSQSELILLKLKKFNTWEEKVIVKFKDSSGNVLKVLHLKTSHYITLRKVSLEGVDFEDLSIEVTRK